MGQQFVFQLLMSEASTEQRGSCVKGEAHGWQKVQYLCLEESCMLNRLLCKRCVHEAHRKHKVGVIDKLIEPLNRLNMNSCYEHSHADYNYLNDRLRVICEEWEKLNDIFYANMRELQTGVLFQLNTVMKTFSNDELDKAHELMLDGGADLEAVNEYVAMVNFLNKDYLQDVEAVKKFADCVAERVKKTISKTVKKVDLLLKKMQDHIKQLDFNKYYDYKNNPNLEPQDQSHNKEERNDDKKEEEEPTTTTASTVKKESKGKEHDSNSEDTRGFTATGYSSQGSNSLFNSRKPLQRYK